MPYNKKLTVQDRGWIFSRTARLVSYYYLLLITNYVHKFFVRLHGDKTYNSFVCGKMYVVFPQTKLL
jgi:hypothetical protein